MVLFNNKYLFRMEIVINEEDSEERNHQNYTSNYNIISNEGDGEFNGEGESENEITSVSEYESESENPSEAEYESDIYDEQCNNIDREGNGESNKTDRKDSKKKCDPYNISLQITPNNSEINHECVICLDDIDFNISSSYIKPCSNCINVYFHVVCFQNMINSNFLFCPTCRSVFNVESNSNSRKKIRNTNERIRNNVIDIYQEFDNIDDDNLLRQLRLLIDVTNNISPRRNANIMRTMERHAERNIERNRLQHSRRQQNRNQQNRNQQNQCVVDDFCIFILFMFIVICAIVFSLKK